MSNLTIQKIRARFNREKPKFIGLKNQAGDWEVTMNNPKIKADKKMLEIEKFFAKESTEDGLYYFIQKESLNGKVKERSTPVAKGRVENLPAVQQQPQVIIQERATEEVWDMSTALDKSTQIIRLEFRVENLQRENADLKKEVERLKESELSEEDSTSDTLKQFKELAETFIMPMADKYFTQTDDKIKLEKERLQLARAGRGGLPARRTQVAADTREDGGIPADHPKYEKYFKMVVEEGSNEQLDNECNYLEEVDPEYYKELAKKYGVEEQEEKEPEDDDPENEEEEEEKK